MGFVPLNVLWRVILLSNLFLSDSIKPITYFTLTTCVLVNWMFKEVKKNGKVFQIE